jgi:hypothetical protein
MGRKRCHGLILSVVEICLPAPFRFGPFSLPLSSGCQGGEPLSDTHDLASWRRRHEKIWEPRHSVVSPSKLLTIPPQFRPTGRRDPPGAIASRFGFASASPSLPGVGLNQGSLPAIQGDFRPKPCRPFLLRSMLTDDPFRLLAETYLVVLVVPIFQMHCLMVLLLVRPGLALGGLPSLQDFVVGRRVRKEPSTSVLPACWIHWCRQVAAHSTWRGRAKTARRLLRGCPCWCWWGLKGCWQIRDRMLCGQIV